MLQFFMAELMAIMVALSRILFLNQDHSYVIYSDSLSALQELKTPYSKNTVVSAAQQFLQLLHSRKKQILLCWTPSHVGVTSNEIAGGETKMTSSSFRSCSRYLLDAIQ